MKMSVNGPSTIIGHVSWVISEVIGCKLSYTNYWLPLQAKEKVKSSLPHDENERQWSVNDSWSCILGNPGGVMLQIVIYEVLAAFIGKRKSTMLPAL